MIATYVLIISLSATPHTIYNLEFNSKEACDKAQATISTDKGMDVLKECTLKAEEGQ